MTYQELYRISRPGSALKLVKYNSSTGRYIPESIPEQLLEPYIKALQDNEYGSYGRPYEATDLLHHAVFSLIGNFVANEATSVIEVEKIFSGDPAFYKKKAISKIERFDTVSKFPKAGKSGIVYVDSSTETAYKYSD